MGTLNTSFSRADVETLLEGMDEWEMVGNQEYHFLSVIKSQPLPEEGDPQYEFIRKAKDYFQAREKDIKDTRALRRKKAIFLKAKLALLLQDLSINDLFDLSTEAGVGDDSGALAEYYIHDLGVWDKYVAFLDMRNRKPLTDGTLDPGAGTSG